jgi:hypothetical protein
VFSVILSGGDALYERSPGEEAQAGLDMAANRKIVVTLQKLEFQTVLSVSRPSSGAVAVYMRRMCVKLLRVAQGLTNTYNRCTTFLGIISSKIYMFHNHERIPS